MPISSDAESTELVERSTLSQQPKKPLASLQKAVNRKVTVRLKNDAEYKGRMANVDTYMNVILLDAEEYSSNVHRANYGKVVIRGNNVLYIRIENSL